MQGPGAQPLEDEVLVSDPQRNIKSRAVGFQGLLLHTQASAGALALAGSALE